MKPTKTAISLGETTDGADFELDVEALLGSRLLIQANSGGGKSWLIRRLAEQLYGKVPVIIIDPEGEFATLREKFGYVLVGKGGETPADIRSAATVAHKLLELGASAVCDLYEMKPQARHQWVRLFLEAMIDSPKELWKSVVVVVDEAHQFCPEGKSGESEASGAMVDLASRGRKRGYCAVFATQRLGKLRKDAAAELFNVMIGMTFIDIDRDRAAESLGISRDERKAFNDDIKLVPSGTFYCLGRALCKERTHIKVGSVQTTHPEAGGGKFSATAPPPPEAIKKFLPKLADLPKQAEEKAKTEADLRAELRSVKAQLAARPKTETVAPEKVSILTDDDRVELEKLGRAVEDVKSTCLSIDEQFKVSMARLEGFSAFTKSALLKIHLTPPQRAPANSPFKFQPAATAHRRPVSPPVSDGSFLPNSTQQRILDALAWYESIGIDRPTQLQTGAIALIDTSGGHFSNMVGPLSSNGLIERTNGTMNLTEEGRKLARVPDNIASLEDYHEMLRQRVRKARSSGGKTIEILNCIISYGGGEVSVETIGQEVSIDHTGGHFSNMIGPLGTLGLIERDRGVVRPTEILFPKGIA